MCLVGSTLRVLDIPKNLETKSRLKELDRLGFLSLLDVPIYKGVAPTLSKS